MPSCPPPIRFVIAAMVAGACAGLCAAGCGRKQGGTPRSAEPVHVVTTVYAMADIARQVGGERVIVEWYVESGQSLEELVETPERRSQFRTAELVVTRGAPDSWTLQGTGNPYQDRKILRLDTLPSTKDADPAQYLWLDPQTAIELADELATRLSALRPKQEKYFKGNADAFTGKVAEMMEQASAAIYRTAGGGPFVTLDRGFLPLARRFGMEEARVTSNVAVAAQIYDFKTLREIVDDAGAGAVFLSSETPTPLVRDWQSRLGRPILMLDPFGSSAPTGRSTYVALLRYNLDQLKAAAARARPTTATTRYLAETVDPAERMPPPAPPEPDVEPTTPSLFPPDSSGIHVPPIPNPYAEAIPKPASQPRDNKGRRGTARQQTARPTTAPARVQTSGIRVAPIPPPFGPGSAGPTTRPNPATLPSPTNPFSR